MLRLMPPCRVLSEMAGVRVSGGCMRDQRACSHANWVKIGPMLVPTVYLGCVCGGGGDLDV